MIINGGIECGHGTEKPQATNRQNYYRKFANYFKVETAASESGGSAGPTLLMGNSPICRASNRANYTRSCLILVLIQKNKFVNSYGQWLLSFYKIVT